MVLFLLYYSYLFLLGLEFSFFSCLAFIIALLLFFLIIVSDFFFQFFNYLIFFKFSAVFLVISLSSVVATFAFIVLLISLFILLYALLYFFSYFNVASFFRTFVLFFLSILFYLLAVNIFLLFLSWEVMGLCSFFLILSFFCRFRSNFAAFQALFWNLSGDISLLSFLLLYFALYCVLTYNFFLFFCFSPLYFLLAVACKSACFPFHNWLFYAMEGPTPVSAFLHAASMITAGIYLLLVFNFWVYHITLVFLALFLIVFFSFYALLSLDFKKIIASSTGSQLGYICFFCLLAFFELSFLLLSLHAFFKFFLFFLAGVFIAVFLYQDYRFTSYYDYWSLVFVIFCAGSLMGLPYFLAGIFKELLLFSFLSSGALFWCFAIILFFSNYYMLKLLLAYFVPLDSQHLYTSSFLVPYLLLLFFTLLVLVVFYYTIYVQFYLVAIMNMFYFWTAYLYFYMFTCTIDWHLVLHYWFFLLCDYFTFFLYCLVNSLYRWGLSLVTLLFSFWHVNFFF